MGFILEKIEEAIKDLLMGWIESNLTNMFTDVNDKVGTIATEVGKTPASWDANIYQMIRGCQRMSSSPSPVSSSPLCCVTS